MTFLEAAIYVRFEAERILAFLKYTLPLKMWLLAILGGLLFLLAIIVIAMGHIEEGFEGGMIACLNLFVAGWLHGVRARGKKGFYDQPFHPNIYHQTDLH
jgi:hypothetical protein